MARSGQPQATRLLDFTEAAACRKHPAELFYPERGEPSGPAKAVCAECPVVRACLDWALHHEKFGVWGGTSERQRRFLRQQLNIRIESPQAIIYTGSSCGTAAGYTAHVRAGQPSCPACRDARNVYQNARNALRRASA
jgi:WhiB family redox-sensing transcriptional regulator